MNDFRNIFEITALLSYEFSRKQRKKCLNYNSNIEISTFELPRLHNFKSFPVIPYPRYFYTYPAHFNKITIQLYASSTRSYIII